MELSPLRFGLGPQLKLHLTLGKERSMGWPPLWIRAAWTDQDGAAMKISLVPMSDEMYDEYFKDYENDPDLYFDKAQYQPYVYSMEGVRAYIERKKRKGQLPMAILRDGEVIGELILKELVPKESVTLGICLRKAEYKDHGYGTQAERLALDYAFDTLGVKTVLADALLTNTRSQHVLEKAGFVRTHSDQMFVYYRCQRGMVL